MNLSFNNNRSKSEERSNQMNNNGLSKFSKMKPKTLNQSIYDPKILKKNIELIIMIAMNSPKKEKNILN